MDRGRDSGRQGEARERRISVGVGAVALREGGVLLVRMNRGGNRGQWSIPGGYAHAGESLEQTVVREVDEETGLRFVPERLVAVRCGVRDHPDRDETNVYIALVGRCGDGEPSPDRDEVGEAVFRPLEDCIEDDTVAGLTREVLKAVRSGRGGLARAQRDVGTNNRYRAYDLYV